MWVLTMGRNSDMLCPFILGFAVLKTLFTSFCTTALMIITYALKINNCTALRKQKKADASARHAMAASGQE